MSGTASARDRLVRALPAGLTLGLVLLAVAEVVYGWLFLKWSESVGVDLVIYRDAAARLLDGGSWYTDRQLAGEYRIAMGDVLYPPTAAFLFVPFLVLPAILWWAIPLAITAWAIWRLQPRRWAWPLIGLCIVFPMTPMRLLTGNPSLWVMAAVSLGTLYGWPSALVLVKPSLAPFALFGIRTRAWWLALGAVAAASLLVLGDLVRYPDVIARSSGDPLYSIVDVPLVAIPVVAWLGSSPRPRLEGGTTAWTRSLRTGPLGRILAGVAALRG